MCDMVPKVRLCPLQFGHLHSQVFQGVMLTAIGGIQLYQPRLMILCLPAMTIGHNTSLIRYLSLLAAGTTCAIMTVTAHTADTVTVPGQTRMKHMYQAEGYDTRAWHTQTMYLWHIF